MSGMAAADDLKLEVSPSSWLCRNISCFEKLEQIGEGTYGQVFKARDKQSGEVVALKRLLNERQQEGFPLTAIREIKILQKLHSHPNIIKLKEVVTDTPRVDEEGNVSTGGVYMVLEYMDHDLAALSDRPGVFFPAPQIKCYLRQLLSALLFCHSNQVLHRDIKRSNLLIDNHGILKLADFGLAGLWCEGRAMTNKVITLWYRPPELLLGATEYGPPVDMWSVGCVFAEFFNHRKPLFPGKDEADQMHMIFEVCGSPDHTNWPAGCHLPRYNYFKPASPRRRRVREVLAHVQREALDLVDRMLTLDPSDRISAKEALDSDYFSTPPLACDPSSLPKYEASHAFQTKKRRHYHQH